MRSANIKFERPQTAAGAEIRIRCTRKKLRNVETYVRDGKTDDRNPVAGFKSSRWDRDQRIILPIMFYELLYGGYRLGTFPTEAEAVRRAGYLPKGRYTVREWERNGEFSTFDPSTNKHYDFNN